MLLSKLKSGGTFAQNLFIQKINEKKTYEILIIVPTNRKVRALTKYLIDNPINKAIAQPQIHTLSTLSNLIFREIIDDDFFILDDVTSIIKLKKIFSELSLSYFPKDQEITQGILFEIKNIVSDFKKKGITTDLLKKDLELLPESELNKAKDLLLIYEKYQEECFNLNLFELGDIYKFITSVDTKQFEQTFKELFPDVNTVFVECFDELTGLEIKIINSIFDIVPESFISFDVDEENPELFSHPLKSINRLKNLGFREIKIKCSYASDSFIEIIKKNLFTIKPKIQKTDVKFYLFTGQNRFDEVSFIAKNIKKLINQSGYRLDDICVAFNIISNYSSIVNEIFSDFNIPFNLTDRFLLSNSAPVIAILNLLMILENNFYFKYVFRALSCDWITTPGVDKDNLLKVSTNLKIISGLNNWEKKINNILEDIDNSSENDFNYLPKESYLKAKNDIFTLAEILEPFNKKLTPREFLSNVNNLIIELGIVSKAVNNSLTYSEKNTRAIIEFVEMLQTLTELLEIDYGKQKHSLEFYTDKIKSAVQFTRYNIKENSGVLITSVDEIRGLDYKVLILGGMVDGEFPMKYSPEIFIPHKYKQLEDGHLSKERYKFYHALSVSKEKIYLTYPKSDEESDLTASSFLNDLFSVVECENYSNADYSNMICSLYEMKKNLSIENLQKINQQKLNDYDIVIDNLILKSEIDYQRRSEQENHSEFNGYVKLEEDAEIQEYLDSLSTKQSFSATKLEEYIKCPFQFMIKRILKLQPYREPIEEVEAFEIGTIVHSILYEFYKEVTEKNLIIENCSDDQFEEFLDLIFTIADRKIKKENFTNTFSFFELEKILGINGDKKHSILYFFLEEERKSKNGFIPSMFEKKFGKYSNVTVNLNEIDLQGTIDRIDIDANKKLFSVIDYKLSGKSIKKEDISEGIFLQLPMYLYAAKKILESEYNQTFEPQSAEIYSLKFFNREFGRKIIHNSDNRKPVPDDLVRINNEMISNFTEKVKKSIKKISKGEFHLSTLKDREQKVCSYCDFISVCRVQEII